MDIDFEGTGATQQGAETGNVTQEETTALDGSKEVVDINNKEGEGTTTEEGNKTTEETTEESELTAGTNIEFDGKTYVVAENGDLVDGEGKVFKQASEVKDWMASLEEEVDNSVNIAAIKDKIGVDITDDNGKPVEFSDDADGVAAYVNSVIELKSKEIQQGAINKLYADNPLLRQFVDYVQITGSPRGFGEIPDRSGIQLDKDNESQLEAVIKMAAQEFGNKSINDSYIKYLKDSGNLYQVAEEQLAALVEKDKNYRESIEKEAAARRQQEQDEVVAYWNNVSDVINGGIIDGYKLPDTFIREVNGKKITETRNDFYNYLAKQSVVDANGNRMTQYQKDLQALTDEQLLNRELLDAFLLWRGGSYKDLVDLKVNEDKVKTLRLVSKQQRNTRTIKVVKPQAEKTDMNDIVL